MTNRDLEGAFCTLKFVPSSQKRLKKSAVRSADFFLLKRLVFGQFF